MTATLTSISQYQNTYQNKEKPNNVEVVTWNSYFHFCKYETPAEKTFREQREAFLAIEPLFLAQYQGQFVVSRDGEIEDHDFDLPALTDRFFSQNPDASVYISKVGSAAPEVIATPF